MLIMDTLETLKKHLYNLDFPGINTMSQMEVADIFSTTNRLHFLSWFYQQLEPEEQLPSDLELKCEELAEFLYENGFCTSSNKLPFVRGDTTLDPLAQIEIFQRMLHTLNVVSSSKENKCEGSVVVPDIHDLDEFLNKDVNVFPEHGPPRSRTSAKREQRIAEYVKEIANLKAEIACLEATDGLNVEYDTSGKEIDMKSLRSLENEVIKFSNKSLLLEGNISDGNSYKFDEKFESMASQCSETIKQLVDYINSIKTITNFRAPEATRNTNSSVSIKAVRSLVNLGNEVASLYTEGQKN